MSTSLLSVPANRVVVIDTSVWISALLPVDRNHAIALSWIRRHVQNGGSLLSPTMLTIETASAVVRATNQPAVAQQAVNQIYTLPFMQLVAMDQSLVNESIRLAIAYKLRGADAVFVALAKIEALPLVSFDLEQITRSAGVVVTIRP